MFESIISNRTIIRNNSVRIGGKLGRLYNKCSAVKLCISAAFSRIRFRITWLNKSTSTLRSYRERGRPHSSYVQAIMNTLIRHSGRQSTDRDTDPKFPEPIFPKKQLWQVEIDGQKSWHDDHNGTQRTQTTSSTQKVHNGRTHIHSEATYATYFIHLLQPSFTYGTGRNADSNGNLHTPHCQAGVTSRNEYFVPSIFFSFLLILVLHMMHFFCSSKDV